MKVRILSLVLALCMILGLVQVPVLAAGTTDPEDTDVASVSESVQNPQDEIQIAAPEEDTAVEAVTQAATYGIKAGLMNPGVDDYSQIVSQKIYSISPGVTEADVIVNDASGNNQNMCHIMEVDLSNEYAAVMPSYSNMDTSVWQQQVLSKQAAVAEQKMGVNVVGGVNTSLSWASDEPQGMLVVNGEVWHQDTSFGGCYLVIHQDNTAELRNGNVPLDGSEWQAVSTLFGWLVKDGVSKYPNPDHANPNRAPRTAIGVKADGSLVLFVVDGRQAPASAGMTMNELAEAMIAAGCVNAVNCDGGGSSTFLSEREGTGKLTVKNSPSDGVERPTLTGLLVLSTAKASGEFDHASISPNEEYYTPGSEISFAATGVDSVGVSAPLPEDLTWALTADSQALGTIDASTGVFTANADAVGVVTVNAVSGEAVVGTASVELVKPDEIYFASDEVSLGFEASTDFNVHVKYHSLDVNYKVGDLIWTLSNEKLGTFDGNIFTSSDGESLNGTVTVTSAFDESVTDTLTLIVGMLPTIVWDFEDYTDPETGEVISAEEYYCGENGILTHSNYNKGGKESIEIISIDDDEPVRMGSHALKLNYDFTQCGAVTEGACVGTTEAMAVPGAPTGIGVWVYAPEGVGVTWEGDGPQAGFWLRGYVKDGLGSQQPYDFTLEPKAVTGDQQPGIYWEGWMYLEADLTKFTGPFSIQSGMTFRLMFVNGTKMGTRTAGSIYFDNLQFVYGTNTDDVDNPVIHSVKVNDVELQNNAVLTTNTFNITADVYDVENKYTSGVDADTVRIYVDGINTYGNDHYIYAVDPDGSRCYLSNLYLRNGQHSLTVSLRDKFGNETSKTYFFTVAGDETNTDPTVTVSPDPNGAVLGGSFSLEIVASDASQVNTVETSLKLDKNYPDYTITFSDDYEGTTSYSKINGQTTITATRKADASGSGNVIATVAIQVPADLMEGEALTYSVKSGSYTTTDGAYYTYSAPEQSVDVVAFYILSSDPVLVGQPGVIAVTDNQGHAASGVDVYLEDGSLLGTSDENGKLVTEQFSAAAGKYVIYAKDAEGRLSFHYTVQSYVANGDSAEPFMIKYNASADYTTEKNISWMTSPVLAGTQYLQYAEETSDQWIQVAADSSLATFTAGGNSAVRISNVKLTGLTPDTTYRYRVGDTVIWSEVRTFTTGNPEDAVSFFALGDIQAEDLTNINAIMGNVKASDYDFGLQTGDAVDDAVSYEDWNELADLLSEENLGNLDMIHVLGNHEFAGDAEGSTAAAVYGLPVSGMGSYYSVTYGDVYVAVINYTSTKAQLQAALDWLEKDAAESDAQWKILTMHQPAYYTNITGGNAEIQAMVPEVVDRAGIDFVFAGHDHSYARTEPLIGGQVNEDGAVYFICGSSGEKSYTITDNPDFHFAKATQQYNAIYLSVEASWSQITVTAYNVLSDGTKEVFDTYTKEIYLCDEHTFTYDRTTDLLECVDCIYKCDASDSMYSGWATDVTSGNAMYFSGGKYVTGYLYFNQFSYYFDENGLGFEGEYTLCGETCLFEDGHYVSCSNANVLNAGYVGNDVAYVLYADGKLVLDGTGETYSFANHGTRPFIEYTSKIRTIQIGAGITRIGTYLFAYSGATNIVFEENSSLKQIGSTAFYSCAGLTEVTLPGSVTYISNMAFGNCSNLTKVVLPQHITTIHDNAFKNWSNLTLYVANGSYAMDYAIARSIPYVTYEPEIVREIVEVDGVLYYYENGVKTYAGLICLDGDYYYVRSNCQLVVNAKYWVTKTNGLLPAASYTFGADGKMIDPPTTDPDEPGDPEDPTPVVKNGIVEENGVLYYYVDGVRTYAGLIYLDGDYYYVRSNCQLVVNTRYWITKTNDLLPAASYNFGTDGKIIF